MLRQTLSRGSSRGAFIAAASVALAASVRTAAPAQSYGWKYGSSLPADFPANVRMAQAFQRIREETKGQLDIKAFPNGALGGDPAMFEQERAGALEMMLDGTLDAVVPVTSITNFPFAFPDYDAALRALDGDLGKVIRAALLAAGIVTFDHICNYGFRQFTSSSKPIHTVQDLKGMKLRVSPGRFYFDVFQSLGTTPVTVNLGETYTALQTHLVDGSEFPLPSIESTHLYEVQKYCSLSRHIWSGIWVTVNNEKWLGLPRNLQDVARKHIQAGILLERKDVVTKDRTYQDVLQRQGLTFNTVDPASFKAQLRESGFYGRWRVVYGETAWNALEKYAGPLR